ncbi:MAG: phosphate acetyltransferase [Candidatus Omnitrophica bacterium]|nr:phosphate acetyltransferase [Candidatus Omnitrophota bacterium]
MDTITKLRIKAKANPKIIALPEYNDKRIVEAAGLIEKEGIAKICLLTPDKIDPHEKQRYVEEFYLLRKSKGVDMERAKILLDNLLYYAAMMTRLGKVDGFVAGAAHTTPDVARVAIQCLGVDSRLSIASSCFVMVVRDCPYGEEGTFVFADCGIIPEPTSRQLAVITIEAAELAREILAFTPRVALLSYSTKGSSEGKSIEKIREALALVKEMSPDLIVDGELQVDTAIVPEVARIKYPESPVAGKANVLIFPDLEAGNISYKLVQRLAKARALGPLILGLNKPCSDLSRGCSVEDIIDCVAITAIRAQNKK